MPYATDGGVTSAMAKFFTACDVVDMAVELERMGASFYERLAELATDEQMKETFSKLADCERQHEQRFRELYAIVRDCAPSAPESYPGEWLTYVRALIESRTVIGSEDIEKLARETDIEKVIKFAMQLEKDSILLYDALMDYVPEDKRAVIEHLLTEEREHMQCLLDVRGE